MTAPREDVIAKVREWATHADEDLRVACFHATESRTGYRCSVSSDLIERDVTHRSPADTAVAHKP